IRDFHVTGVQTCALPISLAVPGKRDRGVRAGGGALWLSGAITGAIDTCGGRAFGGLRRRVVSYESRLALGCGGACRHRAARGCRSEERRVGEERRGWGWE